MVINSVSEGSETIALAIYPNPALSEITLAIAGEDISDYKIAVYNCMGEIQKTERPKAILVVEELSSGLYFLTATKGNKRFACKFIKQ
ncbi:MAG TPA: T9SS type A sorting domain-containing protein [Bacteroidia bacterium]|jgi:hypothetical protein